jgi:hypothetical protein
MSISKNYYVIAGYDLTDLKTDKFEDWRWSDDGEKWLCYQTKGRIQLFDDPMCGDYLYLGFILAAGDEYEFKTTKFDVADVESMFESVSSMLSWLQYNDIIIKNPDRLPEYKIMAFVEYR